MSNESNPQKTRPAPKTAGPESLWPNVLPAPKFKPPATILKEQAAILGQMTQNIVKGVVETFKGGHDHLTLAFHIVAPALDNYSFVLFEVTHKATQVYPVEIVSTVVIPTDIPGRQRGIWKAHNENQFRTSLKRIFAHPKTTTAIQSLMAQSEGLPAPSQSESA